MYACTGSVFVAVRSCAVHYLLAHTYIPDPSDYYGMPMHVRSSHSFLLGTHSLASAHSHSGTRAPWCCSLVLVNMSMFAPSDCSHHFSRLALLTRLAWVCLHSPLLTVYTCRCACECEGFHTLTPFANYCIFAAASCNCARLLRRYATAFACVGALSSVAAFFTCFSQNCSAYQTDHPLRGHSPACSP